mgnify:FL=1
MLKKLFKYDFLSMGKILLPMYGAMLIVGVVSAISLRPAFYGISGENIGVFAMVALVLYFALFGAVCIMSIYLSVRRFKNNLLGAEGYLSNVLPVSPGKHIMSKALSATLWQIITAAATFISHIIVMLITFTVPDFTGFSELFGAVAAMLERLNSHGADICAIVSEIAFCAVLGIVILFELNLMFYAAMTIGHTVNRRKTAASFGSFVGLYIISQIVNTFLLKVCNAVVPMFGVKAGPMNIYGFLAVTVPLLILTAAYSAVYFFVSRYFLSKKLNLE